MENIQQFYWKIKAMTPNEVDRAIAERLGSDDGADYHADWQHAGRLLEMMAGKASGIPDLIWLGNEWICYSWSGKDIVCGEAPTAQEAIARCWLEWWEVTHE